MTPRAGSILLLLLGWLWDRPIVDCLGMAVTDLDHYFLMATVRQTAVGVCYDEAGQGYACETTIPGTPIPFLETPDPGYGLTAGTSADPTSSPDLLPAPPVGAVAAWPWPAPDNPYAVVAVDAAGNWSQACQ